MNFENWTIDELFERCIDIEDGSVFMNSDEVAALRRKIAALRSAQPVSQGYKLNSPETPDGWVACKDRMPEDEQALLVQTHSGFRYVSFYDERTGLFYDTPGGNLMNSIEHILVTHWMPLPAAPEGSNG